MAVQQKIKVLRGFRHAGQVYAPGSILSVERPLAIELRTANKAEFVASDIKEVHRKDLPNPNVHAELRRQARAAEVEAGVKEAQKAAAQAATAK